MVSSLVRVNPARPSQVEADGAAPRMRSALPPTTGAWMMGLLTAPVGPLLANAVVHGTVSCTALFDASQCSLYRWKSMAPMPCAKAQMAPSASS